MRTLFPPWAHPAPGTVLDDSAWLVIDEPDTVVVPAAPALGRVDLDLGSRSLADVLTDIDAWAALDVAGIYLDRAPVNRYAIGPVALAVRVARRRGLHRIVLNPGAPTDPLYRDLEVRLCTFEGDWAAYQRWTGDGARPGDGHLVHGVPTALLTAARHLLARRGAGFGVATDAPGPTRASVAGAGSAGS
ncbi:spherulation-specific family 4 protein [Spirilliplanes yamanashiensis]|uniref:Uncharacterized protein n=1 Tax=Spirilliplanes yamanashiensis TaxID=42233 RepID=A0A8J3Y485_9ACTN|nr:spherulation-specific family 4 protein [Spirilliplanes yamanashiensis]MDP9819734.1 hypothetical protein [Spirilliplanes yamanashiensis]GIJ01446.1 hypothetical protein Sya03_07980 [Spirilliplanes yamanashiensis]